MIIHLRDARVKVGNLDITHVVYADDALTIDVLVVAGRYLGERYRGPQCRWCRADDYRKHDGRCPRCGDHKDRGRTQATLGAWWWRHVDGDWSVRPGTYNAAHYAIGGGRIDPAWVDGLVLD